MKKFTLLKDKNGLIATATLFVLAMIFVVYNSYLYNIDIQEKQTQQSQERLKELAEHNSDYIMGALLDYQHYVAALAEDLAEFEDLKSPEALSYIQKNLRGTRFKRLAIDFLDGKSYTSDNLVVDVKDYGYLERIQQGETFVTDLLRNKVDGSPMVSIVSPIKQNGKYVAAARGAVYTNDLAKILDSTIFAGNGYYRILNSDGYYIIDTLSTNVVLKSLDFIDASKLLSFDGNVTRDSIFDDFKDNKSNFFSYSYEGKRRVGYYMPIGINDWIMMVVVPEFVINNFAREITTSAFKLSSLAIVAVLIPALFAMLFLFRQKKEMENINRQLQVGEQRYRFMLERSDNVMFEYTIADGSMDYTDKFIAMFNKTPTELGLPGSIIENGSIFPGDEPCLSKLFNDIIEGKASSESEFRIKDKDGTFFWCYVTVATIFDEKNKPIKAIGVIENIQAEKELEEKYREAQLLKSALLDKESSIFEVNLTKNCFISGFDIIEKEVFVDIENNYEQVYLAILERYNTTIDPNLAQAVSTSGLIQSFKEGESEKTIDINTPSYKFEWTRYKFVMYEQPKTGDICAIFIETDITAERKKENELIFTSQRDQLTGLYNKMTTQNLIAQAIFEQTQNDASCAVMIIDIDNFKLINDKLGHFFGDKVIVELAENLKPLFRGNDIVGRIGGDEFFVFMKNISDEEIIRSKAQEINEAFRKTYTEDGIQCSISASIGISIFPKDGHDFEKLYKKSDIALYETKEKGKDGYNFYEKYHSSSYMSNRTVIDTD